VVYFLDEAGRAKEGKEARKDLDPAATIVGSPALSFVAGRPSASARQSLV